MFDKFGEFDSVEELHGQMNLNDYPGVVEQIPSEIQDCSNEDNNVDGVSSGFGTAGDAGASGEVSEVWWKLWLNIDEEHEKFDICKARADTFKPKEMTGSYIQELYDTAVNLAAAVEKYLIYTQKQENSEKNGQEHSA